MTQTGSPRAHVVPGSPVPLSKVVRHVTSSKSPGANSGKCQVAMQERTSFAPGSPPAAAPPSPRPAADLPKAPDCHPSAVPTESSSFSAASRTPCAVARTLLTACWSDKRRAARWACPARSRDCFRASRSSTSVMAADAKSRRV